MRQNDFESICYLAKIGEKELVNHPESREDGRVLNCDNGHLVVETTLGEKREWNFNECYEIHLGRGDYRFG